MILAAARLGLTPEKYAAHFTGQAQGLDKKGRFSKVSGRLCYEQRQTRVSKRRLC
jgi:hypothetical protein